MKIPELLPFMEGYDINSFRPRRIYVGPKCHVVVEITDPRGIEDSLFVITDKTMAELKISVSELTKHNIPVVYAVH